MNENKFILSEDAVVKIRRALNSRISFLEDMGAMPLIVQEYKDTLAEFDKKHKLSPQDIANIADELYRPVVNTAFVEGYMHYAYQVIPSYIESNARNAMLETMQNYAEKVAKNYRGQ